MNGRMARRIRKLTSSQKTYRALKAQFKRWKRAGLASAWLKRMSNLGDIQKHELSTLLRKKK